MGSTGSTLNRMPHQRIRETSREPVATPNSASEDMAVEPTGYETNLEDLNLFARYVTTEAHKEREI